MKCPKCGYVGFQSTEKCRNCGYHFALAEQAAEVDLRLETEPPFMPPADLDFKTGLTPPPLERRPRARNSDFDLPAPTPRSPRAVPVDEDLPLFDADATASAPSPHSRPASAPAQRATAGTPRAAMPPAALQTPSLGPARSRLRAIHAAPTPAPLAFDLEPAHDLPLLGGRPGSQPRPAGPLARVLAGCIDILILGGLDLGVLHFTLRVCRLTFADVMVLPMAPLIGFYLLLDGAYLVGFTANGGQTIGKMATSIRAIGEDGSAISAGQAFARTAGYFASVLPAGLGFLPALFDPARRALHDRLANTRVIRL